jgi:hypothetical protein
MRHIDWSFIMRGSWRLAQNSSHVLFVEPQLTLNLLDLPDRFADRAKFRQDLVDEVNDIMANLPEIERQLEEARELLRGVDPFVWRQERIVLPNTDIEKV